MVKKELIDYCMEKLFPTYVSIAFQSNHFSCSKKRFHFNTSICNRSTESRMEIQYCHFTVLLTVRVNDVAIVILQIRLLTPPARLQDELYSASNKKQFQLQHHQVWAHGRAKWATLREEKLQWSKQPVRNTITSQCCLFRATLEAFRHATLIEATKCISQLGNYRTTATLKQTNTTSIQWNLIQWRTFSRVNTQILKNFSRSIFDFDHFLRQLKLTLNFRSDRAQFRVRVCSHG